MKTDKETDKKYTKKVNKIIATVCGLNITLKYQEHS